MDHAAAALALDRMAAGLHEAGDHLVGPGLAFTRRALSDAAAGAETLAGLHRAAAREQVGRDYLVDLLDATALAAVHPL